MSLPPIHREAPASPFGTRAARSIGDVISGNVTKNRRTFQPVRRNSYHVGEREHRLWRPIKPREIGPRMKAAEIYERSQKEPGKRNGPLGHTGIEVLRELYRIVCYRTGRLDPSIDYLMRRIRRSRAAVVAALARLRAHGFLNWIRRTEPTDNAGQGPQVRQITNAYFFGLPEAAAALVRRLTGKAPPPDDDAVRRAEAAQEAGEMLDSLPLAERIRAMTSDLDLAAALTRLAARVARDDASSPGDQNPAIGRKE